MIATRARRQGRSGRALVALACVFGVLVFGLAFTIYGVVAAVLAVICGVAGALKLSRSNQPPTPSALALAFNPPPGWPSPPSGWVPPAGWQPDPSWPPPPTGWQFWSPTPEGDDRA